MFIRMLSLALVAALCLGLPAAAQEAPPMAEPAAPAGPTFEPKAEEVFEAFQRYAAELAAFRLKTEIVAVITADGETQDGEMQLNVAFERPGNVRIEAAAEGSDAVIGATGGEAYIYVPELAEYLTAPAPSEMWQLVMSAAAGPLQTGATFIAELLAERPYEQLMADAMAVNYVGEEELDGRTCHRIEVKHARIGWDMWIDVGDQPLLRKATPHVQEWLTRQGEESFEIAMTARVTEWDVAPGFAEDHFVFDPPEGVEKVDQLGAPESVQPQEDGQHPLVGQEAPAFTLPLLGGGEMDLATHKGQDIVILDFWATWCGPCRTLMPIISDVARDYRDKNVVLYAVNIDESEEQIRGFLDNLGLDLRVLLDEGGAVATRYQAIYIPQTVIIDKDGIVQVVHTGVSAGIERQLRDELDALLEGVDLASKTLTADDAVEEKE